MVQKIKNLVVQEEGQALTEYGLIIALVSVLLAGSLILFKTEIAGVFTKIIAALKST
ncbi:Flp family type IVb pilin [Bacillus sp. FJAT-29814]|uniref:Flp family type IVb pilin n=1 Tax=Bacillus sp. FJAT-29814 TaxID=1729688 RepID=UPI000B2125B2|nr:Flp family type IVb pilin [Bacillus sp. FJAT-29814]